MHEGRNALQFFTLQVFHEKSVLVLASTSPALSARHALPRTALLEAQHAPRFPNYLHPPSGLLSETPPAPPQALSPVLGSHAHGQTHASAHIYSSPRRIMLILGESGPILAKAAGHPDARRAAIASGRIIETARPVLGDGHDPRTADRAVIPRLRILGTAQHR